LAAGDTTLYVGLYGDADTMLRIASPLAPDAALRSFQAALRMNGQRPLRRACWVILDQGLAVGLAGLVLDGEGGAEVGVVLPPAQQGRGHATRAIATLADHAFGPLSLSRLHTRHEAGHVGASALMDTLGFEPLASDEGDGTRRWQLTAVHWATRPRAAPSGLRSPAPPDPRRRPS
jgi:RimJ/RimL family protein N-acetyltransferase